MFAKINGARLAYSDRGKGHETTLLLVHGFPLDQRLWSAQLSGLSSVARAITPDLRGHGKSEVIGPYTMDQHADDLAALLDHVKVKRVVVAGLSMGGYVAFAFWRRHPDRVQALILADTRAGPDSVVARANRDAAIVKVQQAGVAAYAEEMLPRLLSPVSLSDPRTARAAHAMMAAQPAAGVIGDLESLRDRSDSRPTLPTITAPTLVLVGEDDVFTPPADAQKMAAAIPGAKLAVIPGAGHLSPMENPKAFNAAVRKFLWGVPQAGYR